MYAHTEYEPSVQEGLCSRSMPSFRAKVSGDLGYSTYTIQCDVDNFCVALIWFSGDAHLLSNFILPNARLLTYLCYPWPLSHASINSVSRFSLLFNSGLPAVHYSAILLAPPISACRASPATICQPRLMHCPSCSDPCSLPSHPGAAVFLPRSSLVQPQPSNSPVPSPS